MSKRMIVQDFVGYCPCEENVVIRVAADETIIYDGKVCELYGADFCSIMRREVVRLGCAENILGETEMTLWVE